MLTGFAVTFFSGFLLANPILICTSSIPLFILFMGVVVASPKVKIKKIGLPETAMLDEIVEVEVAGKITGGPGVVAIFDEVPESFRLVEGNNFKVVSKEFEEEDFSFSYKIRCTKCGDFRLGISWETRNILGLAQTHLSVDTTRQLRVYPALSKIRRMKLPMRTTHRIHPSEGISKIGPLSTDFKEIRNYHYGDPFKIINWKASAKAAGRSAGAKLFPLVNEYEREGKWSTWLFLDGNPDLKIGTSVENALDFSVRVTYGITYYFLSKGYNVGMYVYNHHGETVRFDTGKKQFKRIADVLLRLTPPQAGLEVFWDEGFSKAVVQNQKSLTVQHPAITIVTHVTPTNWGDLQSGLRRLLFCRRQRKPNVMLINVLPYDIIPQVNNYEVLAAKMLDVASRSFSDQLRSLGLTVLDWNPKKENMEFALLNTTRLR